MYSFKYTPELVKKIAKISEIQGRVTQHSLDVKSLQDLKLQTNIEAVHFSTKLEGNALTLKQVTEALTKEWKGESRGKSSRSLLEVINYSQVRAFLAKQQFSQISLDLIIKSHDLLLKGIVIQSHRGKWRQAQNVIKDSRSNAIVYLPPKAEDVVGLMTEMVRDVRKLNIKFGPLITSAYFHFAFVSIHPFMDGNGRLARLFTNLILDQGDVPLTHYSALERRHEMTRIKYYKTLHALQGMNFYDINASLDITLWIDYHLDCILESFKEAEEKLFREGGQSLDLGQFSEEAMQIEGRLNMALSLFKKFKKLRAMDYESLAGVARTQAVDDLNNLIRAGLIEKVGGGRSTVYRLKKRD